MPNPTPVLLSDEAIIVLRFMNVLIPNSLEVHSGKIQVMTVGIR
jgi:hypothetical protein